MGLGLKNLEVWNQACVAKLVWAIAMKKDLFWVRWIHGRYLKTQQWDFKAPSDACWYLKKLCRVKDFYKWGSTPNNRWKWHHHSHGEFTVSIGYLWSLNAQKRARWARYIWSKACIPRQAIIWWLAIKKKLLVKQRLSKYMQIDTKCKLCNEADEDHNYVFITCRFPVIVWRGICNWMGMRSPQRDLELWLYSAMKKKQLGAKKDIKCTAIAATVYNVWYERNKVEFYKAQGNAQEVIKRIMEQVRQRILFLEFKTHRYTQLIEQTM